MASSAARWHSLPSGFVVAMPINLSQHRNANCVVNHYRFNVVLLLYVIYKKLHCRKNQAILCHFEMFHLSFKHLSRLCLNKFSVLHFIIFCSSSILAINNFERIVQVSCIDKFWLLFTSTVTLHHKMIQKQRSEEIYYSCCYRPCKCLSIGVFIPQRPSARKKWQWCKN